MSKELAKKLELEREALARLIEAVERALRYIAYKHPTAMAAPDVMAVRVYIAALKLREEDVAAFNSGKPGETVEATETAAESMFKPSRGGESDEQ